jgi:tol-pal system protein YbgF
MARRDSLRKIFPGLILAGAVILFTQSCATNKYVLALHNESMARNQELESRLADLKTMIASLDSLFREQNKLLLGMRALSGIESQNQHQNLSTLTAQMENINYQLNELNRTLKAIQLYGGAEQPPSGKSSAGADTSKTGASSGQQPFSPLSPQGKVDSQQIYDLAIKDFQNGDYEMATNRFMAFLLQFPDHVLAGNAQFWLGEADYAQKKYDLAISDYEKVIKNYPQSPKVPAAYLKMGFAQIEAGKKNEGIITLRLMIKNYPKAEEAGLARERLKKVLGK